MTEEHDILDLPLESIVDGVTKGTWKATDLAAESLNRVRRRNPSIHAFLFVDEDSVLKQAQNIDEKRRRNEPLGALAGIPFAVKDCICTQDAPTSCASLMLMDAGKPWMSHYDATVVARLRQADAILVGKTNLDEFGLGNSTQSGALGPTYNPWNTHHVPGGSSGGSAAAVAAGMVPIALGSGAGGSLCQPASFTSTVGLRPTWGRVSRWGVVAGTSLEQVGPIAKRIRDAARVLTVIAGRDGRDAMTSSRALPCLQSACEKEVRHLRLGIVEQPFDAEMDEEVRRRLDRAIEVLRCEGVELFPIRLPHASVAVAAHQILTMAEISSNFAKLDGIRFGARIEIGESLDRAIARLRGSLLGAGVKRSLVLGTGFLSPEHLGDEYLRAKRARAHLIEDFEKVFQKVDALIAPVSLLSPWRIDREPLDLVVSQQAKSPTIVAGLAGLPSISVPCGFTSQGLPIGLQFMAPKWREDVLCQVACGWERWFMARGESLEVVRW